MNTDVEETLNKIDGLIKDDQERRRRFNRLMDRLSVPMENGAAAAAVEQLSSKDKRQAEQDLVHIFQQIEELSAAVDDFKETQIKSTQIVHESNKGLPVLTHTNAKKPHRPIRMRGLTI